MWIANHGGEHRRPSIPFSLAPHLKDRTGDATWRGVVVAVAVVDVGRALVPRLRGERTGPVT